ncbi:MAG: TonB-dependent receptor [Sphingobium sp.]
MKNFVKLGMTGSLIVYTAAASAQQTNPVAPAAPQTASADAVPKQAELGEIVVTAQRRSERLRDVPITITAVSGENLAKAGITSTKELSIAVPGLAFTTQGAWAQPNIRGVTTFNSGVGAESPIAVYVDGVYYVNQVGSVFDMPDVERIEVLKGPQGTLFGRNATGGAISIHTLDPSLDKVTGKVSAQTGFYFGNDVKTAREIQLTGFLAGPLTETLAASATGYYTHNNGYLTNDLTGGRYGRREAYMFRGKLLFEPSDSAKFLLSVMYGRDDDDLNSSMQPLNGVTSAAGQVRSIPGDLTSPLVPAWPGSISPTKPWHTAGEMKGGSHILTKSRGASLKADFDIPGVGGFSSLSSYLKIGAESIVDVDASYSPPCLEAFACINFDVLTGPNRSLQQEFTFASEKFGAFSFVTGLFLYDDKGKLGSNINFPLAPDGEPLDDQLGGFYNFGSVHTKAWAGFGEANLDATDRLHLIAGIRYSYESKRQINSILGGPEFVTKDNWNSWTPRLSARYDISDRANVYATYSKGFKSGVLNSTANVTSNALPETLTSYEIGTKIGAPGFNLSASAFYYDYRDLQLQFFDGVNSILTNAANAKIWGFEADGSVKLSQGLELRVAGSWVPHAKYANFENGVDNVFWPQNDPINNPNGFGPIGPGGLMQVSGIDASGDRLLKTPKFTGNVTLSYDGDIGSSKIDASTTLYYSSSYDWNLARRVVTKQYATLSGRIGIKPNGGPVHISVFAKNLTNEHHFGGAVLSANADVVLRTPPRQVGVNVGYAF